MLFPHLFFVLFFLVSSLKVEAVTPTEILVRESTASSYLVPTTYSSMPKKEETEEWKMMLGLCCDDHIHDLPCFTKQGYQRWSNDGNFLLKEDGHYLYVMSLSDTRFYLLAKRQKNSKLLKKGTKYALQKRWHHKVKMIFSTSSTMCRLAEFDNAVELVLTQVTCPPYWKEITHEEFKSDLKPSFTYVEDKEKPFYSYHYKTNHFDLCQKHEVTTFVKPIIALKISENQGVKSVVIEPENLVFSEISNFETLIKLKKEDEYTFITDYEFDRFCISKTGDMLFMMRKGFPSYVTKYFLKDPFFTDMDDNFKLAINLDCYFCEVLPMSLIALLKKMVGSSYIFYEGVFENATIKQYSFFNNTLHVACEHSYVCEDLLSPDYRYYEFQIEPLSIQ